MFVLLVLIHIFEVVTITYVKVIGRIIIQLSI